jgi:hypothetical protein
MSQRFLTAMVVAAAGVAFVSLTPIPSAGQAPAAAKAKAKAWVQPKTPWGDPDIQGMWPATDLINVPMQRDLKLGERNVLNDEEFAVREAAAKNTAAADSEEFAAPDAKAGINPPSYWLERGKPQRQASLVVDPPNGRIPPLTEEATRKQLQAKQAKQTRGANDSWTDHSLYDRCISRGVMGSILPVIYNNGTQIIQAPGQVAIRYEMIHETRVIPLDGRPHVGPEIRSYMGDARGHWDGNTLVVETTNFLGDRNGIGLNGGGTPHSDALVLTERWTRTGPDTLNYEATINDPKTFTKPWKILMPLKLENSYQLVEYACHEGNYALMDMLSGARSDEQAAAAAKK